jgi:hypothetical protein
MAIDVFIRLKDHNAGKNRFTKRHLPWKLFTLKNILTGPSQENEKNILNLPLAKNGCENGSIKTMEIWISCQCDAPPYHYKYIKIHSGRESRTGY